jgi:hypothetical protein
MELQRCLNGVRLDTMAEEIPLKPARGGLALPIDWEALKQAAIAGVDFRVLAIQFRLFDKHGKPNTNAIRQRAYREAWPIAARIVRVARKNLKDAIQAAHKQASSPLNSSQAIPLYNANTVEANTGRETNELDMEPGFDDLGNMAGIEESGSGKHRIRGDSASIPASKAPKERGKGGDLVSLNQGNGREGGTTDASRPITSSESLAATLIQGHMAQLAQESIMQALTRAHASIHAAPASLPIATIADLRSAMKLAMEATGLDKQQSNQTLNILVSPTPKTGTWNFHDSPESLVIDT